jgi:predicted dehydrogenase
MIHDLDIVLGLVESKVAYLDVVGVNVVTPYEDIANVRMRFESGCVANITASRLTPERQRKIRIFQEDAYISLDYEAQSAQIFTRENGRIHHRSVDIQKEEPLKRELQEFVSSVQTGSGLGKPDIAARNALELALRITDEIKKNAAAH